MNIPDKFKEIISAKLYDKTVFLVDVIEGVDKHGYVRKGEPTTETGSFLAHVWFNELDKIQEEYGIDEKIDIALTTDEAVSGDQVLRYGTVYYKVVKAIPYDSHKFVVGKKCLLRSSTSISA